MTCILYVDDSRIQLENVRAALAAKGHDVRLAASIDEAVALMEEGRIEIAIIDYHMPGVTGVEVLQEIRAQANPPSNVRFFLYTTDHKVQVGYRQHGFHGALLRKGDTESLLAQLDPVVRLIELGKVTRR